MNFEYWWHIRKATENDKDAMLRIAHQYRNELGYVHPVGLMEHARNETVFIAERHGELLGFVDYHQPKRGDNKGYSVVYHLAVDKHQRCQGIGRNLLYAVPAPVRLKCTIKNERGNEFYKSCGMRELRRDDKLITWQMAMLVIWCQGNNRKIPAIARDAGMAYGTRNDEAARDYPFMLDINWKSYNWRKYIDLVREYRPVMAMVPDYEFPGQFNSMWERAEQLRDLGVLRVLVCPKFDKAVNHIPRWCVVAVSVPTSYAGYLPDFEELRGRQIHLLGGSPPAQMELRQKINGAGGHVISVDGNIHTGTAYSHNVWNGKWIKIKRSENMDFYANIGYSAQNIQAFHNQSPLLQPRLL